MKVRHVLAVAAAGLVLATTTAAHAAGPPYTVSVGGSSAPGTHSISAASNGTVSLSYKNNAGTTINMNCTSLTFSGSVASGPSVNPVWAIAATTWTGCRMPGGNATITQSGTWNLTGTGVNASSGTESITGYVGNVSAGLATTANPAICSFTFSGQMNSSFSESTQTLSINETGHTGNLVLSNVSGCLGQWQNGNPMNLVATLNVTSPDGAINLS